MPEVPQPASRVFAWKLLRSPRLALFILSLTMLYAGAVSWLPWLASAAVSPPTWAVRLGLDHPFRSVPFLVSCVLLFLNTFACTLDRFGRVRRMLRGELPAWARQLPALPGGQARLAAAGFKPKQGIYFKNRFALWGGFILHVGILCIIASVAVQQTFSDGGSFEVSEQEIVDLRMPGVVFDREAGYLAPAKPPALQVALERFDAYRHQAGYAPDRLSSVVVLDPAHEGARTRGDMDRSRGLNVGESTIYQAIPSGFAVQVEVARLGVRSVHLREIDPKTAHAEIVDPAGEPARFILTAENRLNDPKGTGNLSLALERRGGRQVLHQGEPFPFGSGAARVVGIARWGGFTYARTPGIGLVFAGFAVALAGCFLLLFPAGVARFDDSGAPRVLLNRGVELLLLEWRQPVANGAEHDREEEG